MMYVYDNGVQVKVHCYNVGKSSQRLETESPKDWLRRLLVFSSPQLAIFGRKEKKSKHTLAPAAIRRTQRSAVLCRTCKKRCIVQDVQEALYCAGRALSEAQRYFF